MKPLAIERCVGLVKAYFAKAGKAQGSEDP